MKSKLPLILIVFVNFSVLASWAQAPSDITPALEDRANAMLKQLSLEEKVDLIGGVTRLVIIRMQP